MAELKCKDGTVIQISEETEAELRAAFWSKPVPVFGDIVSCKYGQRVLLYDKCGKLRAHRICKGKVYVDFSPLSFYTPTSENIFKNNLQFARSLR